MLSVGTLVFCLLAPAPDASGEPPAPVATSQAPVPPASPSPEPSPSATPAPPAPDAAPMIAVHGYLSQAFALSDGNQLLGIPSSGTFDYRTAALQMRVSVSPDDTFVIQAAEDRLGESPTMSVRRDVDLDWIFYERRLGEGLSVRAGRVKTPFGVFNEVRYVGPLLPFFRAPDAFYSESSYSFDSLDGVVLTVRPLLEPTWSLDVDVYAGQWRLLQTDNRTFVRAKKGLGAQVWLNTPLTGVRVGLAAHRSGWRGSIVSPPGATEVHHKWAASFDANLAPLRAVAEYERDDFEGNRFDSAYALVSWHATRRLSVSLQATQAHIRLPAIAVDANITRDVAAGLSYSVRRYLVLKLEYHREKGIEYDEPELDLVARNERRTGYAIMSVATLF